MPIRGNTLHLSNELITLNELKTSVALLMCIGGKGGDVAGRDEGDLEGKTGPREQKYKYIHHVGLSISLQTTNTVIVCKAE